MRKRRGIIAGLLFAAFICGTAWMISQPPEASYGGKKLSIWLDQLCSFDFLKQRSQGTAARAVRAIGTNAIPWLLQEYRHPGGAWKWRLNQLLDKQRLINYRFRDADYHLYRATVGFQALGEIGAPAIPDLLALVEAEPGYVPGALAGIGRPAVPALQQCLTNITLYTNSLGTYAVIPGNTITEIYNANRSERYGPFSKSDFGIFLSAIQAWARQTTNLQAQTKAQWFLKNYDSLQ